MTEWLELIKCAVRPFIIIWGFMVYGICVMTGVEIPQPLAGLITAVIVEYFGERAYRRLRDKQ
jgi:hypothetical protein